MSDYPSFLTAQTGQELHSDHTLKVNAFYVPRVGKNFVDVPASKIPSGEVFLHAAAKNSQGGVAKIGNRGSISAVTGHNNARGFWSDVDYSMPEGSIVKIFVSKRSGFGSPAQLGAIFIKMRKTAAYNKICIDSLRRPNSAIQEAVFSGRFDIISDPDRLCRLNVDLSNRDASLISMGASYQLFKVVQIEPEISGESISESETITTDDGGETTVFLPKPKRKISGF